MARVIVNLQQNEKDALCCIAQRERRNPREQAALLIRRELERAGLIQETPLAATLAGGTTNGATVTPTTNGRACHEDKPNA